MAQLQGKVSEQAFYQLLADQIEEKVVRRKSLNRRERSQPGYHVALREQLMEQRKESRRTELNFRREEKHFWSRRMYFVYSMLMGNGVDGLPQTIRMTFELSAFVFVLVRFMAISIFLLPVMEVEVFMGKYSKLSNSQMYRMAPLAFGLSAMNFIFNALYVPILMTEMPVMLLGAIRMLIHSDYLTDCKQITDKSTAHFCFDYKQNGSLIGDVCNSSFLSINCDKHGRIAYVSQFYFWQDYYDFDEIILENHFDTWPLILVCCISWFILLSLVLFGMKCMEWFFVLSSMLYGVILFTIIIMVVFTDGAAKGLQQLVTLKQWPTFRTIAMVVSLTTINLKLISPVGHMTYAAFIREEKHETPSADEKQDKRHEHHHQQKQQQEYAQKSGLCFVVELLHLLYGMVHIMLVAMIGGILAELYGVKNSHQMFIPRVGMYYAMIIEFLQHKNASIIFKIAYYLTVWALEVSKMAIVVHFQILNVFDFFPSVFRFENYVRIAWGIMSFILTLVMTYRYFFWFIPTYHMANVYFIEAVRMFALSFILFYVYGIKRIEDDFLFETGKKVVKVLRIIWPIYPLLYLGLFISMVYTFLSGDEEESVLLDVPYHNHNLIFACGLGISAIYLIGALGFEFLHIIMGVASNSSLSKLMKPDFHWGPFDPRKRRERKEFAPRIKIRSSRERTRIQRFRQESIHQMHQQDIAADVKVGRIFLDSHFYTHCTEKMHVQESSVKRHIDFRNKPAFMDLLRRN